MNIILLVKENNIVIRTEQIMPKTEFKAPQKSYFAAANGYSGFRSYFDEIFDPKKFSHVFILKGGPGTGKSTFMKNFITYFQNRGFECEAIFCSSDPHSLDGAIIHNQGKSVAIVDGTAPHLTDGKIPGAIDEIINLGAYWNEASLYERRKEIIKYNEEKTHHYKRAYEYLSFAGYTNDRIAKIILSAYNKKDHALVKNLIPKFQAINRGRNKSIMLFASFGKYGYNRFSLQRHNETKGISICGNKLCASLFLSNLHNELSRHDIPHTKIPSPFSDEIIEEIIIGDNDYIFSSYEDFDEKIDSNDFFDPRILSDEEEALLRYEKVNSEFIEYAQNEFALASKAHFILEDIYIKSMTFSKTEELIDDVILKSEKILSK